MSASSGHQISLALGGGPSSSDIVVSESTPLLWQLGQVAFPSLCAAIVTAVGGINWKNAMDVVEHERLKQRRAAQTSTIASLIHAHASECVNLVPHLGAKTVSKHHRRRRTLSDVGAHVEGLSEYLLFVALKPHFLCGGSARPRCNYGDMAAAWNWTLLSLCKQRV